MHEVQIYPQRGDDFFAACLDCSWESRGPFDEVSPDVRSHGVVYVRP